MKIGYATCVGPSGLYERVCVPAIEKYRAADSPVLTVRGADSQFTAYNTLLDQAAEAGCDALVLLHDDVEMRADPVPVIEKALEDPSIGLLGTLGGLDTYSLAWWRVRPGRRGYVEDRRKVHNHSDGLSEVHAIDDVFLVAPRWAIEHLRFAPNRYRGFEGLGVVMSTQARAAGKAAAVIPFDIMHHNDGIGFNGIVDWRRNELRFHRDFFALTRPERIRNLLAEAAVPTLRARIAMRRLVARMVGGFAPVPHGESGEPVVDRYVEDWLVKAQRFQGRLRR